MKFISSYFPAAKIFQGKIPAYSFEDCLARMKTREAWYNKSYSGYLFGLALQGVAIGHGATVSPYAIPYGLFFQNYDRPDHFDWFWDSELLVEKREDVLTQARAGSSFASDFYQAWKSRWDVYIRCWEKIASTDITRLAPEEIRKLFVPLYAGVLNCGGYAYVVDTFLNDTKQDWLEELLKKELGSKADAETIAMLTAPVYPSFVNDFEIGKLALAKRIVNGETREELQTSCEALARAYFWIRTNYHSYVGVSAEDVYQEAKEEAEKYGAGITTKIAEEERRIEANKKRKAECKQRLQVSAELARVLEISEVFTHIQDKRKEAVLRSNVLFFQALEVTEKKLGIEPELMFYLTPAEFLSTEMFEAIDWDEVRDRKIKGALLIFCAGGCQLLSRAEFEKQVPVEHFFASFDGLKEVRGSVAFAGKVQGRVRVVRNIVEIEQFVEGEILVANQTTPEYVPAMKKASAFVTDQGGITCHAAIISREMQKPCVIGTKIATKVLKDGDFVEVDADRGMVVILPSGHEPQAEWRSAEGSS